MFTFKARTADGHEFVGKASSFPEMIRICVLHNLTLRSYHEKEKK